MQGAGRRVQGAGRSFGGARSFPRGSGGHGLSSAAASYLQLSCLHGHHPGGDGVALLWRAAEYDASEAVSLRSLRDERACKPEGAGPRRALSGVVPKSICMGVSEKRSLNL